MAIRQLGRNDGVKSPGMLQYVFFMGLVGKLQVWIVLFCQRTLLLMCSLYDQAIQEWQALQLCFPYNAIPSDQMGVCKV